MLCDTGPLVALFDKDDAHHEQAQQAVAQLLAERLNTRWPCLTEALYLLGKLGGQASQDKLLQNVEARIVTLCLLEPQTVPRIRTLMSKYSDHPMDFADASLVVLAETKGERRVFTFDSDFHTYLIHDRIPFEVIP